MAQTIRQIVGGGAAVLAASALTVSAAGVAVAQDGEAYPEPTVSTQVDGNNIITTITDNGGGDHNGEEVVCMNLGLPAIDALPLAGLDPDDINLEEVMESVLWIELNDTTTSETPEVVVDANANRDNVGNPPLEAGVYASVGACVSLDLTGGSPEMVLESMDYDAPIFVPGGIGSVGQALDLGSSALSAEGGSSNLLNAGSDMMGS